MTAGRKPKPTVFVASEDAREFLVNVMRGIIIPSPAQLDAAKALVRGVAAGGKKAEAEEKADVAATGKFAPKSAPKLVVNND